MGHSIASTLKALIVPAGTAPRRVWTGLFRGLTLNLDLTSQTQFLVGLHERETYRWTRRLTAGARTAFDVGAAQGEYAIAYSKRLGVPSVVAFEPESEAVKDIGENMRLNGVAPARVRIAQGMVGVGEGMVPLDASLPTVTYPLFVKVDVDGGELNVLESACGLIDGGETRWLIETHSAELERDCLRFLEARGMKTQVIPNAWWRAVVPELRPIPHNRWMAAWPASSGVAR